MEQDRIFIKDLLIRAIVGVNQDERKDRQDVLINITLTADVSSAITTDDLDGSVDYRAVTKEIIAHTESARRFTVEALAGDIARICLSQRRVRRARIRVEKPGALRFAGSCGVEIERGSGWGG